MTISYYILLLCPPAYVRRQVQSETLFPVEEVHLEEDFFSEFTYTSALLTAEVRFNLLASKP